MAPQPSKSGANTHQMLKVLLQSKLFLAVCVQFQDNGDASEGISHVGRAVGVLTHRVSAIVLLLLSSPHSHESALFLHDDKYYCSKITSMEIFFSHPATI